MQTFKTNKGSAFVEAALIFPLLILIIFALIKIALVWYGHAFDASEESIEEHFAEEILRARWIVL